MTTTTHTPATLAALAPRELDALAHECVFAQRVEWSAHPDGHSRPYALVDVVSTASGKSYYVRNVVPDYSRDLNEVTLLEAELARRGLPYIANLLTVIDDGWYVFEDWASAEKLVMVATASAEQRTIAAILAAQDSPYLNIVAWDKHPRDAS